MLRWFAYDWTEIENINRPLRIKLQRRSDADELHDASFDNLDLGDLWANAANDLENYEDDSTYLD